MRVVANRMTFSLTNLQLNSVRGVKVIARKSSLKIQKRNMKPAKAADYTDPRFQNLFKSSLFVLDLTDPQYKRSVAYARQVGAQKQNGVHGDLGNGEELTPHAQLSSNNSVPGKKVEDDLKS